MRRFLTLLCGLVLPLSALSAETSSPLGKRINDFQLQDFRGKTWSLNDFAESHTVVVAFLGTECPLVQLYSQRLAMLADTYVDRGVAFIGINANQQDSLTEMAYFAKSHGIRFPLLKDAGNKVVDQFGAKRTPEVFVLDRHRRVRYHGRIDDQYTYGIQRPKVEHEHLRQALDALLANKKVPIASTEVVGCLIGRVRQPDPSSEITYAQQISRILQNRCVKCHRPGEIAPFSLTDYDEVVGWAEMIAELVEEQRMPPWHADPKHGDFINDARMTEDEKALINDWVAAGAPLGDKSKLPDPVEFFEGWRIGKPDLIVKMSQKPYPVPAEGEVKYQYFTVDPGFQEDKWISSAECRPGNRAVVHHIIVTSVSRKRFANRVHGDLESEWLTATAPGARPLILPDGMAKRIPAGSKLVFQMHYTPNGTAQQDLSSVGLIFADPKKVKREVATQKAAAHRFRIPPGADNHRVEANYRFGRDTLLLALFPHMHLRGKSFNYTVTYPDKREEVLLNVPRYDFNWQNSYEFREPKLIPAGTKLKCVAHFDNSENNLANPDPTATVRWGDQTWEEMMIGYFDVAIADLDLTKNPIGQRTDQFLKQIGDTAPRVDRKLAETAAIAFESRDTLKKFGLALRKVVPQMDRIDWMTIEDGTLEIRGVAQSTGPQRASVGLKVPAARLAIARYASDNSTVVHGNTGKVNTPDFKLLAQLYSSSIHIPIRIRDTTGIVNIWSTEFNAFPVEAVEFLKEAVEAADENQK